MPRRSSPQLEDGYTRLANELLDALCIARVGSRELAVALAIIRKTFGWQKAKDRVSGSQLSDITGIPAKQMSGIIRSLSNKKIISVEGGGRGRVPILSLQKDHTLWTKRTYPKRGVSASNKGTPVSCPTYPSNGGKTYPKTGVHNRKKDTNKRNVVNFGSLKRLLSPQKVALLAAIRPKGVLYSDDQIQAWFLAIRPVMIANGRKSPVRAAANWFARIRPEDMNSAVSWVEMQAIASLRTKSDNRDRDTLENFVDAFGLK